jgi:prevent-host-death family protein
MFDGLAANGGAHAKPVSNLVMMRCAVQTWPVQDAKARFREFLETCLAAGTQMVTKRGAEAAVLIPVDEWRRLQAAARPSLKRLLLTNRARAELAVPLRGSARRRPLVPAR